MIDQNFSFQNWPTASGDSLTGRLTEPVRDENSKMFATNDRSKKGTNSIIICLKSSYCLCLESKCFDDKQFYLFVSDLMRITYWCYVLLNYLRSRFWSNLVFEPDYIATIVSFLQEAVPAYIPITSVTTNQQIIDLYTNIANNTLTVLCRMITNKESEACIGLLAFFYWEKFESFFLFTINLKKCSEPDSKPNIAIVNI